MFSVRFTETGNSHRSHICIRTTLPGTAASLSIPTFYGTLSPIHKTLYISNHMMNDNLNNIFKVYLNNNLHTVVLWVATPCSLVGGHQSFGETDHHHLYLVP